MSIDLNAFFYPGKLLQETATAFQGVCKTKITPAGNRVLVELKPLQRANQKLLALNFCNYCLALQQSAE